MSKSTSCGGTVNADDWFLLPCGCSESDGGRSTFCRRHKRCLRVVKRLTSLLNKLYPNNDSGIGLSVARHASKPYEAVLYEGRTEWLKSRRGWDPDVFGVVVRGKTPEEAIHYIVKRMQKESVDQFNSMTRLMRKWALLYSDPVFQALLRP